MFYLHSKDKDNKKIIILGRKTYKWVETEKDARWDGHFTLEGAQREVQVLESLPNKFWKGPISIVEL